MLGQQCDFSILEYEKKALFQVSCCGQAHSRVNKNHSQQRQLRQCCRTNFHFKILEQLELGDVDNMKRIRTDVTEIFMIFWG